MAKQKSEKLYITQFIVTGRGYFPYDMLRYDRACPFSGEDASKISNGRIHDNTSVKLVMFSGGKDGPTKGRWSSFGWEVVDVRNAQV
jgi:hypothetical protein